MEKKKSENDETETALKNMAEAVVESKTTTPNLTDDPFDFYVQRVQSGVFSKGESFSDRFIKGYHALMNELKK